jgi:hypothetical protein
VYRGNRGEKRKEREEKKLSARIDDLISSRNDLSL